VGLVLEGGQVLSDPAPSPGRGWAARERGSVTDKFSVRCAAQPVVSHLHVELAVARRWAQEGALVGHRATSAPLQAPERLRTKEDLARKGYAHHRGRLGGAAAADDHPGWALLEQGDVDGALGTFGQGELAHGDGLKLLALLANGGAQQQVHALQLARATRFRRAAVALRPLLDHEEVVVRLAAVQALGDLGGAGDLFWLQRKLQDSDPGVVQATQAAVVQLRGG